MNITKFNRSTEQSFRPGEQTNRQFQPFQQRGRPNILMEKEPKYVNKIDDALTKDFFGVLQSGSLGDITAFYNSNKLLIYNITNNGDSPLHVILKEPKIIEGHKLEICKFLISKGANVNAYDKIDITPVQLAAQLQLHDVLDLLISNGGNVNATNNVQQNALHMAVKPLIRNCYDMTPKDLIPKPEIKNRDINNVSRAIWQHLIDYFKIKDYPTPDANHKPLHLPLLAIKNIIDSTGKYIELTADKSKLPPEKDELEKQRSEITQEIQKNIMSPTMTATDKKSRNNDVINEYIKRSVKSLETFYDDSTTELKFDNDESFVEDPTDPNFLKLQYFSSDQNMPDIFSSGELNFKSSFQKIFEGINAKYDQSINKINPLLNDFIQLIRRIYFNVKKLHAFNFSNSAEDVNINIGSHMNLNNDLSVIEKYKEKYQLQHIEQFSETIKDLSYQYIRPTDDTNIKKNPYDKNIKKKWSDRIYLMKNEYISMLNSLKKEVKSDKLIDISEVIFEDVIKPDQELSVRQYIENAIDEYIINQPDDTDIRYFIFIMKYILLRIYDVGTHNPSGDLSNFVANLKAIPLAVPSIAAALNGGLAALATGNDLTSADRNALTLNQIMNILLNALDNIISNYKINNTSADNIGIYVDDIRNDGTIGLPQHLQSQTAAAGPLTLQTIIPIYINLRKIIKRVLNELSDKIQIRDKEIKILCFKKFTEQNTTFINSGYYINLLKNDSANGYKLEQHTRTTFPTAPFGSYIDDNIEANNKIIELNNKFGYITLKIPFPPNIYNIREIGPIPTLSSAQQNVADEIIANLDLNLELNNDNNPIDINENTLDPIGNPTQFMGMEGRLLNDTIFNRIRHSIDGILIISMTPNENQIELTETNPIDLSTIAPVNRDATIQTEIQRALNFVQKRTSPSYLRQDIRNIFTESRRALCRGLSRIPGDTATNYFINASQPLRRTHVFGRKFHNMGPNYNTVDNFARFLKIRYEYAGDRKQFISHFINTISVFQDAVIKFVRETRELEEQNKKNFMTANRGIGTINMPNPRNNLIDELYRMLIIPLDTTGTPLRPIPSQALQRTITLAIDSAVFTKYETDVITPLMNASITLNRYMRILMNFIVGESHRRISRVPISIAMNDACKEAIVRTINRYVPEQILQNSYMNTKMDIVRVAARQAGLAAARNTFDGLRYYNNISRRLLQNGVQLGAEVAASYIMNYFDPIFQNRVITNESTIDMAVTRRTYTAMSTVANNLDFSKELLEKSIRIEASNVADETFNTSTIINNTPIQFNIINKKNTNDLIFRYTPNNETNNASLVPIEISLTYRCALTDEYYQDSNKVVFEGTRDDDGIKSVIKLVINLKNNFQYFNSSILYTFFKTIYEPIDLSYIDNEISKDKFTSTEKSDFIKDANIQNMDYHLKNDFKFMVDDKGKYNYYKIYNMLNQLNFNIDEFTSYYLYIYSNEVNEGLNMSYYEQADRLPIQLQKYVRNIMTEIKDDSSKIKNINETINKTANEIVSVLNAHQSLIINYNFVSKLFTSSVPVGSLAPPIFDTSSGSYFTDQATGTTYLTSRLDYFKGTGAPNTGLSQYKEANYKLTLQEIIKNKNDPMYKIVGLFTKPMPKLPKINYENATKIDEKFFEQAHPLIEDMEFIVNTSTVSDLYLPGKYFIDDYAKAFIDEKFKEINDGTNTKIGTKGNTLAENTLQQNIMASIIMNGILPNIFNSHIQYITNMIECIVTYNVIKNFLEKKIANGPPKNTLLAKFEKFIISQATILSSSTIINFIINEKNDINPLFLENINYATNIKSIKKLIYLIMNHIDTGTNTSKASGDVSVGGPAIPGASVSDNFLTVRHFINKIIFLIGPFLEKKYKLSSISLQISNDLSILNPKNIKHIILLYSLYINACAIKGFSSEQFTSEQQDVCNIINKSIAKFIIDLANSTNPAATKNNLNYVATRILIDKIYINKTINKRLPIQKKPDAGKGRLLMVPNNIFRNDIQLMGSLWKNNIYIYNRPVSVVAASFNFIRYDKFINKNVEKTGIIGVKQYTPAQPEIDLLDPKKIPFNLTNNYKEYLPKKYASYGDLTAILKRVFISMVLDTRNEIIYAQKPKKSSQIFGHDKASEFTLYDYIKKSINKQLGTIVDANNRNVKILTNRVIAKGVDLIVSQNIKNYLNAEATKLQIKALENIKTIDVIPFNLPIMPDVRYTVRFSDVNDSLSDLLTEEENVSIYGEPLNIINTELLLMEDSTIDIDVNEFNTVSKNSEEIKQKIYYKNDYSKMDESIVNRSGLQCIVNDVKVLKRLISGNINVNQPDIWGNLPITYAIEAKDSNMVSELLNKTNLYFRNGQNQDTLSYTIAQEIAHQNILINDNTLTYCENYKQMMSNIFEVNEELKKNIPKNIEIINYFPIFYLNSMWTTLLLKKDFSNAQDLYNLFEQYVSKDPEYKIPNSQTFMFMLKSGPKISTLLDATLKLYSTDLGFGKKIENLEKKILKYDDILKKIDNGTLTEQNLTMSKEKLIKNKTKISDMIKKLETADGMQYDISKMTTSYIAKQMPNTPPDFGAILEQLDPPTSKIGGSSQSLHEMTHFLLGKLIKEYYKNGEPLFRIENIHLFISNIYSNILAKMDRDVRNINLTKTNDTLGNKLSKYYSQIYTIEGYLKTLCDLLDQRYIVNNVFDNEFNRGIFESISYSTMIAIQNGFVLAIKKLLINHVLQTYGVNKINNYRYVINLLMGEDLNITSGSFNNEDEKTYILSNKLKDASITEVYVKEILNYINVKDEKNEEYTGYDKIIAEIKQRLISNPFIPIKEDSLFIKNYDEYITPYYKALYKTMVEHQKRLVFNYIKFIINQYEGVKILKMILSKVIT